MAPDGLKLFQVPPQETVQVFVHSSCRSSSRRQGGESCSCSCLKNEAKFACFAKPTGQSPVQPAVGDPALAGALDCVTHRSPFQPRPFCDSVTASVAVGREVSVDP